MSSIRIASGSYRTLFIVLILAMVTQGLYAQSSGQPSETPYRDGAPAAQQPAHPGTQSPYDQGVRESTTPRAANRDTVPERAQSDWSWLGSLFTLAVGFGLGYLAGRRSRLAPYAGSRPADRDRDRVA